MNLMEFNFFVYNKCMIIKLLKTNIYCFISIKSILILIYRPFNSWKNINKWDETYINVKDKM